MKPICNMVQPRMLFLFQQLCTWSMQCLWLFGETEVAPWEGSSMGISQMFPATTVWPVDVSLPWSKLTSSQWGELPGTEKHYQSTNSDTKINADELATPADIDDTSMRHLYCFGYWCHYHCRALVFTWVMWEPEYRVLVQMEVLLSLGPCQVFSYLSWTLKLNL